LKLKKGIDDTNRIVLAAHHQKADLDALLRAIDAWE
jgi:hypothetical protein